jgi:hypothetical protein
LLGISNEEPSGLRSGGLVPLLARERLRDHQATAAKAIATHSAAMARLDTLISRRADVLAAQDALLTLQTLK